MSSKTVDWSKLGVQLAVILFIFSTIMWAYQTYLDKEEPKLNIEIISNEQVLDFREELSEIIVFFKNQNLKELDKNISVINLRIINRGNQHILKTYYDENHPISLHLSNSKLVNVPIITNSSDESYYKEPITILNDSTINIKNLIFDSNGFFDLKLFSIHKQNIHPHIKVSGKISGMNEISVIPTNKSPSVYEENRKRNTPWYLSLLIGFCSAALTLILEVLLIRNKKNRKRVPNT